MAPASGLASIVFALIAVESLSRRARCRDPAECYRDEGGPECPGSRTAPAWANGDGAWVNTTYPTVEAVKSVAPLRRHGAPEVRPSGFKVEEVP
jgi:hypothetical protein